jgi:lysophospholipase L1-like esterase
MFISILALATLLTPDVTSTVPVPRDHDWWIQRTATIQDNIDSHGSDANILFIGDSITQGWEGNGAAVWQKNIAPLKSFNLGISGDRTEHVLWRLQNGHLHDVNPDVAVVMIGTNNFGKQDSDSPSEVYEGVISIVDYLKNTLPEVHVLLLDIFPRGQHFNTMRGSIMQVNQALQTTFLDDERVTFLPIGHLFLEKDGAISAEIMPDYLHLSNEGYEIWSDAILPSLHSHVGLVQQFDLANDTYRQVTIDKEPNQYLGHPTTVLLDDGATIICIYPKGHGKGQLVMKKSSDGGATWSSRLPVPASWSTSKETPHIYQVVDQNGIKRLILFSSLYPIRMSVSEDEGTTWTELESIGDYGGIVGMSDLLETGKGAYTAFFHDDGRFITNSGKATGKFYVYAVDSIDGGLNWSEPRVVAHDPSVHLCEPGIVVSPDGSRVAMLLRENSRKKRSHVCFSDDKGKTWTKPIEMNASLTGDRHQAVYDNAGRLFVSFRDTNPKSSSTGDWVAWIGSFEDLEAGEEGEYRIRLSDNKHSWDCAYPGVQCLPDGTIFTATYGHWDEGEKPYIRGVHIDLEQLERQYLD